MTPIQRIENRKTTVADTYASLMRWAKKVYDIPADTSVNIDDFRKLDRGAYALAVQAGLATVVAEYDGLKTAQSFILRDEIEAAGWYFSHQNTWRKPHPDPVEMPYEAADIFDAWEYEKCLRD